MDGIARALDEPDPLARLKLLTDLAHDLQATQIRTHEARVAAINELLDSGLSRRAIARELGISHTAVNSLAAGNDGTA